MNSKQKAVLLAMTIANTAMALFPPWRRFSRFNSYVTIDAGYGFLLSPPSPIAFVNIQTLSVQIGIITLICLVLIYFLKSTTGIDVPISDTSD